MLLFWERRVRRSRGARDACVGCADVQNGRHATSIRARRRRSTVGARRRRAERAGRFGRLRRSWPSAAERARFSIQRSLPSASAVGAFRRRTPTQPQARPRANLGISSFRGICTSANKTPRALPKIGAPTPPEIEHHFLYKFLLEMNIFVKKIGVWRRAPIFGAACPTVARRKRRVRRVRRRPKRYARHEHRRSPTALDRRSAPKVR